MEQIGALNANFICTETNCVHGHIAFSQLSKLLNCFSLKQTTIAIAIALLTSKTILLEYWFGYGTGIL